MQKELTIWICITSLALSVIAVCLSAYRAPDLSFDYQGVIVGVLSLLTTALIGWQIFSVINLEKRIESKTKKLLDERSKELNDLYKVHIMKLYAELCLTSLKSADFYKALVFNDAKISACRFSRDSERFAKDILEQTKFLISQYSKMDKETKDYLAGHIDRLKSLCDISKDILDGYFSVKGDYDDILRSASGTPCPTG